jgi:serine/threonine-protein kinase
MSIIKRNPALGLGLGITLLFIALVFVRIAFLDALDLRVYDFMMGLRSAPDSNSDIVMVDIDDDAIEKLGRWPWPRSLLAQGIQKIDAGQPKLIGLNLLLSEPQKSDGLEELDKLEKLFTQTLFERAGKQGRVFLRAINQSRERLDNDKILAAALTASDKVVLPVLFKEAAVVSEQGREAHDVLIAQSIQNVRKTEGGEVPRASDVLLPIDAFLNAAQGIGHFNLYYDMDGTARRERLIYEFGGLYVPSYTLRMAALYLNLPPDKIRAELGVAVKLGQLTVPTTWQSEMLISFKGPRGSFKRYAYFDVLHDKIPASVFKNKLVLVSPSAAGIMNPLSTPTDPTMPVGEFSAHVIWSIINKMFVQQPAWAPMFELVAILVIGLIITFLLPRLKAVIAGITFVVLLLALTGSTVFLFMSQGLWVQMTYPLIELVLGYIGVVSLSYFVTETKKDKVEGESAETNRMLGLSFQSQGMLDMAFDKFRRVPVDTEMKDTLYNLALDYERKRQFNKAAAVYEYIEASDSKFKDVAERKTKLIKASETMVFGDGLMGSGTDGENLLATGTDTRPTLGRYEVLKQLGKGAMGVVYLGQDPRINRTTAIKTFRFGEDFKPEEVDTLKEKFFREAESAGTLSHPNIVTIYDAGDEQDLAYIAMEYLEGETLEKFTADENLLPMREVIDHVAAIADGLDYAHQRGIVHRDIKPANIMLLNSGVIKITDFGIARITATSQTQTGVVKGTPYYMSPEQFSGEKVDGRSDIFSLGTMLYQLLTGKLPFYAESPPALMHKIMQVRHPDPRSINSKIAKPLVTIINKALEKDRDKRYQRAIHMSAHLKQTGKWIDDLIAKKKRNP